MRDPDQNGISRLCNMLEIYHSGLEPLIYSMQDMFDSCSSFLFSNPYPSYGDDENFSDEMEKAYEEFLSSQRGPPMGK